MRARKKVVNTAGIIFVTTEGELVMQRRDAKAPSSANKLGLFGGHMRDGEDPIDAIIREVHEETTVPLEEISYQFLDILDIPAAPGHDVPGRCYMFFAHLKNDHFKVFEGVGAEKYDSAELMLRDDIGRDSRIVLEHLRERKLWP